MNAQPHSTDKNILVISADDSINDDTAEMEVIRLESDIVNGSTGKVVIDCSRIDFLSSYGIGIMLRLRNAANMVSGEVRLCGVNPVATKALQISRITHLFTIHPDLEQAVQAFKAKAV